MYPSKGGPYVGEVDVGPEASSSTNLASGKVLHEKYPEPYLIPKANKEHTL